MYMNLWENLVFNNITGEKYTLAPYKQTNVWCDVNKSLNIGAGKSCDCCDFYQRLPSSCHLENLSCWGKSRGTRSISSDPQRDFESLKRWDFFFKDVASVFNSSTLPPLSPSIYHTPYLIEWDFISGAGQLNNLSSGVFSKMGSVLTVKEVCLLLSKSCQAWQLGQADRHLRDPVPSYCDMVWKGWASFWLFLYCHFFHGKLFAYPSCSQLYAVGMTAFM